MKVMVETSAHHVHVSEADLEALFGKGATLTNKRTFPSLASSPARKRWRLWAPRAQ